MKKKSNDLELKYIDQRYEGLEAWIRFKNSEWIRLDFLLEYYLLKNVNLSKKYKGKLDDQLIAKCYYGLLYDKFSEKTSGGENFDFQKYIFWQRNNQVEVNNALKLLNS